MKQDSTGKDIKVGDLVRWRGQVYQIKEFREGQGRSGTASIEFTTPPHTPEVPDEISVDLVTAAVTEELK